MTNKVWGDMLVDRAYHMIRALPSDPTKLLVFGGLTDSELETRTGTRLLATLLRLDQFMLRCSLDLSVLNIQRTVR